MTDKHVLIALIVLIIIRYQLDVRIYNVIIYLFTRQDDDADGDDFPTEQREEQPPIDWTDNYDSRIEQMKNEIDEFNKSPNNAETAPGVYNIPHESIKLDIDLQPAVEEEEEVGPQEIAY